MAFFSNLTNSLRRRSTTDDSFSSSSSTETTPQVLAPHDRSSIAQAFARSVRTLLVDPTFPPGTLSVQSSSETDNTSSSTEDEDTATPNSPSSNNTTVQLVHNLPSAEPAQPAVLGTEAHIRPLPNRPPGQRSKSSLPTISYTLTNSEETSRTTDIPRNTSTTEETHSSTHLPNTTSTTSTNTNTNSYDDTGNEQVANVTLFPLSNSSVATKSSGRRLQYTLPFFSRGEVHSFQQPSKRRCSTPFDQTLPLSNSASEITQQLTSSSSSSSQNTTIRESTTTPPPVPRRTIFSPIQERSDNTPICHAKEPTSGFYTPTFRHGINASAETYRSAPASVNPLSIFYCSDFDPYFVTTTSIPTPPPRPETPPVGTFSTDSLDSYLRYLCLTGHFSHHIITENSPIENGQTSENFPPSPFSLPSTSSVPDTDIIEPSTQQTTLIDLGNNPFRLPFQSFKLNDTTPAFTPIASSRLFEPESSTPTETMSSAITKISYGTQRTQSAQHPSASDNFTPQGFSRGLTQPGRFIQTSPASLNRTRPPAYQFTEKPSAPPSYQTNETLPRSSHHQPEPPLFSTSKFLPRRRFTPTEKAVKFSDFGRDPYDSDDPDEPESDSFSQLPSPPTTPTLSNFVSDFSAPTNSGLPLSALPNMTMTPTCLPQNSVQFIAPTVLTPFDPETCEISEFLRKFETIGASQCWTSQQKLMTFPLLLSTVPSEWYREYVESLPGPLNSWTQLSAAVTKAFTRRGGPDRAEAALRKRKMKEGESVDTYLYDVVRLCKLVDASMKESRKIHYITRGLLPVLFHQIMAKDFKSVAELRQHLHRLEDARHTFGEDSPYFQMLDQSSKKTNELTQEMQTLKSLMQQLNTTVAVHAIQPNMTPRSFNVRGPSTPRQPPEPSPPEASSGNSNARTPTGSVRSSDGRPICYQCEQVGHVSRYCQNPPYCKICKIEGDHTFSACPRRQRNRNQGNAEQRVDAHPDGCSPM